MFKILIDTCVWLDLAKDHRQEALLTSLEALVHEGEVSLIVPRIVLDEFSKNKKKIVEESSRSLSSSLKRARDRIPHPDIAGLFSRVKSLYMTGLAQTLQRVAPQLVTSTMLESEWSEEPRSLTEVLDLIGELSDKIWYDRHQLLLEKINSGKIKVVEKKTFPIVDHQRRPIQRDVLEGAIRSARKVEKKYGIDNLGPWSKFEWGMMNGKLSALRWVLGEDWETTLDI
jgi:PIN domain